MKAVIIKEKDYSALPFLLCDAIWEISHRNYGFEMISRETRREIDKDIMVGILRDTFTKVLDSEAEKDD
jgi:hypothetical protein